LDDVGRGATSTDTLAGAGSVTGFFLGCVDVWAVVTDCPPLASVAVDVLATFRFGFFGVVADVNVSDPDFLSFTAGFVVDFLLPPDVSLPMEPLLSPPAPAPSSPADAEDWDDSVEADDEGD
jgi:hypothetical protein